MLTNRAARGEASGRGEARWGGVRGEECLEYRNQGQRFNSISIPGMKVYTAGQITQITD